jgi:hypothetical protein
MASTLNLFMGWRLGIKSLDTVLTRTDETMSSSEVTLNVAVAGTLTTRTSDSVGIVTVASHSITTADTVAIFWTGGYRYGVAVSATAATTISVGSGGSGDVLPASSTALTICKETTIGFAHDGDDIIAMLVHSPERMSMNVRDTGPATEQAADITANEGWFWISNATGTSPFAGDSLQDIIMANAATTAKTATVLLLKNSI